MVQSSVEELIAERAIVSESRLSNLLQKLDAFPLADPKWSREHEISSADIPTLVRHWAAAIERNSARLCKHAMGTLDSLATGCMYEDLEEKDWKRAALACEVLRHPEISKNSGWLNTRALQRAFANALKKKRIELRIAWGQSKRDAGGLKTAGPFADLAELYAIGRLAAVVQAIRSMVQVDAHLTVLSGGTRFADALGSNPSQAIKYDAQRQTIADALSGSGLLTFKDYVVGEPRSSPEWLQRYNAALREIKADQIAAYFNTVLLNIDWGNLFSTTVGSDVMNPREPSSPAPIRLWIEQQPHLRAALIQAGLTSILNPRCQVYCQAQLGDTTDIVQETVNFMRTFAWECTRKYIALQYADSNVDAGKPNEYAIRLTVHEKRDKAEIPALFTLGRGSGNLLSQHVSGRIQANGKVQFETVLESRMHQARAVLVSRDKDFEGDYLFSWLTNVDQPLCFLDQDALGAGDLIAGCLDSLGAS